MSERDSEGFESDDSAIIDVVVPIGKSIGREVESEDVHEILKNHDIELNTEELQYLQEEQQNTLADDLSSDEDEVRENVPCSLIMEMREVQLFVGIYHPDTMLENRAVDIFHDNAMMHLRKILQRRHRQLTLSKFLVKKARKANAEEEESTASMRQRREETQKLELPSLLMQGTPIKKACNYIKYKIMIIIMCCSFVYTLYVIFCVVLYIYVIFVYT